MCETSAFHCVGGNGCIRLLVMADSAASNGLFGGYHTDNLIALNFLNFALYQMKTNVNMVITMYINIV